MNRSSCIKNEGLGKCNIVTQHKALESRWPMFFETRPWWAWCKTWPSCGHCPPGISPCPGPGLWVLFPVVRAMWSSMTCECVHGKTVLFGEPLLLSIHVLQQDGSSENLREGAAGDPDGKGRLGLLGLPFASRHRLPWACHVRAQPDPQWPLGRGPSSSPAACLPGPFFRPWLRPGFLYQMRL